jgi:hypothetical protein
VNDNFGTIATADRPRDYAGLLWIFAAGILGFGMFCATSAVALSDSSLDEPIAVAPGDLVNRAFSDMNAAAVLTAQAFAQFIPTNTTTPTATFTQTASPTLTSSPTATQFIIIVSPTSTRRPSQPTAVPPRPTNTPIPVKPNTPTSQPPPPTNPPPETPTETPNFEPDTPVPDTPVPTTPPPTSETTTP